MIDPESLLQKDPTGKILSHGALQPGLLSSPADQIKLPVSKTEFHRAITLKACGKAAAKTKAAPTPMRRWGQ